MWKWRNRLCSIMNNYKKWIRYVRDCLVRIRRLRKIGLSIRRNIKKGVKNRVKRLSKYTMKKLDNLSKNIRKMLKNMNYEFYN